MFLILHVSVLASRSDRAGKSRKLLSVWERSRHAWYHLSSQLITNTQSGKPKPEYFHQRVFSCKEDSIVPLRTTEQHHHLHHVNLFWLTCGEESQYYLITDVFCLVQKHTALIHCMYFCPNCLHISKKERSLQEHQQYCSTHGAQRVENSDTR